MNLKKAGLFVIFVSVVLVALFAQRDSNAGVSATITSKPGAGRSNFYYADVRNTNPYRVSVEIIYTFTRSGSTSRPQSTWATIPARQTRSIQIISGSDLRVRIVGINVTPLE